MTQKTKKQHIRNRLLEQRRGMSETVFREKSSQICKGLKELPDFKKATVIHCYVSINKRREVNTHPLIKKMIAEGKKVVVPITQVESGTLLNVELSSFDDLKENEWGVLEPGEGAGVPSEKLDFVIVPMLGGDRNKNRIGYGKGFYDRFLKDVQCKTAGLLYERSLIDKVPVEPFDISLSLLITEEQIIR